MKSDQRVALITGAARGIGLATARKFLAENHRVALLDIDAETLSRAMKLMDPDKTLGLECDVAEPNQVKDSVDRLVSEYGRIDVLVNNAGIATFSPILETSFEEWSRILAVNLNGPFICTQACAPVMLENGGGSIVNIASISGFRASTLRVAYGTSKAGVMQLTKQQAAELGNMGIRVNAVAPVFESGQVWYPEDEKWAEEVIEECAAFPHGENDDYVDTVTQAVLRYRQGYFLSTYADYEEAEKHNKGKKYVYY